METEKNKYPEITLILIPPIFNSIDISSEEVNFISLPDIAISNKKSYQQKREKKIVDWAKEIYQKDYNGELISFLQKKSLIEQEKPLFIINYPRNQKQLDSFKNFLSDKKVNTIVISSVSDSVDEYMTENYIVCPLCEKIYRKKKDLKFLCPKDNLTFDWNELEIFTEFYNLYFSKNMIPVIRELLDIYDISSITLRNEEEVLNLPEKLLRIVGASS